MTEAEWLASEDQAAMLQMLGVPQRHASESQKVSDRKLRLWVEACRDASGFGPWANSLGAGGDIKAAVRDWSVGGGPSWVEKVPLSLRAHLLRDIVGTPHRPVMLEYRHDPCPYCGSKGWHGPKADDDDTVWCRECHKPRSLGRLYCPWLTPTVVSLAHAAYDSRDPETGHLDPLTLSAVADALEEAGCAGEKGAPVDATVYVQHYGDGWFVMVGIPSGAKIEYRASGRRDAIRHAEEVFRVRRWETKRDPGLRSAPEERACWGAGLVPTPDAPLVPTPDAPHPLLAHLRSPGPHVRGCHVVDLLTGRE